MTSESDASRSNAEIIAAWHRYQSTRGKEDFWAFDVFHEIVPHDPTRAWALITGLIAVAPEETLGAVGAGPLEDFVVIHGNEWIEKIHTEARKSPPFRESLSCIWIGRGSLSREAIARLVEVTGGRIKPLDS